MRLCNVKPVISKIWSEAFIWRHCQTLMLRINLGLTLFSTLEAKLWGMAALLSLHIASTPPVWIRTHLFWIFFWCKILRRSGCKLRVANQILHSMTCSNELHLWSKELCWWMFVSHNSMPHLLRYEMLTSTAVCHRALQMRFWYPKREICLDHLCLAVFGKVQIAASNGFCRRVLVESVPPLHGQKFGR